MNQIREIVTKAVVAKGKKKINLHHCLKPDNIVYSILGVWIINHEFEATRDESSVNVDGSFEVNLWYSYDKNQKTDIARQIVKYDERIKTRQIVNDYIEDSDDIAVRIISHPTCRNASIDNGDINLDIEFDLLAEIIGETKMQVTILKDNLDDDDEEEDFENIINEDFLGTEK